MFSIIIPLYNKEKSISTTLRSILSQTVSQFEVIIVNDGSTDRSLEEVLKFNDQRITIINKENGGVSSARNTGIRTAKYNWITFIDADDMWMENHLETLSLNIENYQSNKVFCNSYTRTLDSQISNDKSEVRIVSDYFKEGYQNFFFWTGVVCVHREVFNDVGYFNPRLVRGEDLEVWMNIGRKYPIVLCSKVTAIYNQESENKLTRSNIALEKCIEYHLVFTDKSLSELKYLQMLANNKLVSLIKQMNFKDAIRLITKHNFNLIRRA